MSVLSVSQTGNVLLVGLNNPQKRNALPASAANELIDAFTNIPQNIGAAVLYSTSDHFCSGLDLADVRGQSVIESFELFRKWQEVFHRIQFGEVPVIAAITGAAIGAGIEISTACHIRVVDDSAWFSLPEAERGLYVGLGASVRLPRIAGLALMMDMMLTGRKIKAEESLEFGLAQYSVPVGKAKSKAIELAEKISSNMRFANRAIIHALPRIVDQGQDDGLYTEALVASVVQSSPETAERLSLFLDKVKRRSD